MSDLILIISMAFLCASIVEGSLIYFLCFLCHIIAYLIVVHYG